MPSRLTTKSTVYSLPEGADSPTGILNHPTENGIATHHQDTFKKGDGSEYLDRDGNPIPEVDSNQNKVYTERPQWQVEQDARALATACLSLIESSSVEPSLGPHPYSQAEEERALAHLEGAQIAAERNAENVALTELAGSLETGKSQAAVKAVLQTEDPGNRPMDYAAIREVETLKSMPTLNPGQKARLAMLRQRIKRLEEPKGATRGLKKAKRKVEKRIDRRKQSKLYKKAQKMAGLQGIDEEWISRTFAGNIPKAQRKHLQKLEEKEAKELRNQFGRKGTVLQDSMTGRRYYVQDVISTPAQAHQEFYNEETGQVELRVDEGGHPLLYPVYLPKRDDKGNLVVRENGTVEVEEEPLPRQDRYHSGNHKDGRSHPDLDLLYYEDGTTVPGSCKGPDSFDPADDVVVIKPLLSGDEVIQWLVHGSGESIEDIHSRVGNIEAAILASSLTILSTDKERRDTLARNYIFKAPDHTTTPGIRPPHDEHINTGHFSRPNYPASRSSRQLAVISALQKYAAARRGEATKTYRSKKAELLQK